jgi:2-oxoisovalerate dehydrogenase E1 component
MPKSQFLDPAELRKSGTIKFKDIPVNAYNKTVEQEKKNYSNGDFVRIYHDIAVIREFETMLNSIKVTNAYNGINYTNPGPAHLSVGQEAAAVGQAYILGKDDFIFGSHRSHGEIIAKALSCIQKMDDKELDGIMSSYMGGVALKACEKFSGFKDYSVKEIVQLKPGKDIEPVIEDDIEHLKMLEDN